MRVRWFVLVALFSQSVLAAVTPNSLRLVRAGVDVRLSWVASAPPTSVYRRELPDSILNPANLVVTTSADFEIQPWADLAGSLYFYQVADLDTCVCDDGNSCTIDTCDGTGCRHEVPPGSEVGTPAELVGHALSAYPWFDSVLAINEDRNVEVAVDPYRFPGLEGKTCDVYVLDSRNAADWCADPSLTDVRGAPDGRDIVTGGIRPNSHPLVGPFGLSADAGTGLGVGCLAAGCRGAALGMTEITSSDGADLARVGLGVGWFAPGRGAGPASRCGTCW